MGPQAQSRIARRKDGPCRRSMTNRASSEGRGRMTPETVSAPPAR